MMVDRLPGIPNMGRAKLGPVDNSSARKVIKKHNLSDAKSHFPYKVDLTKLQCTTKEVQQWLMAKRYRSWKQKGLQGDYYYKDWSTLWFANKDVFTEFVLSMSK